MISLLPFPTRPGKRSHARGGDTCMETPATVPTASYSLAQVCEPFLQLRQPRVHPGFDGRQRDAEDLGNLVKLQTLILLHNNNLPHLRRQSLQGATHMSRDLLLLDGTAQVLLIGGDFEAMRFALL